LGYMFLYFYIPTARRMQEEMLRCVQGEHRALM